MRLALLFKTLNLNDLNEEEKLNIYEIMKDYLYQFHLHGDKLGATTFVTHKTITNDNKPVSHKNYRYPNILREEVRRQVGELVTNGMVQSSNSPYNSPLWIVPKKSDAQGKKRWRMVIDYRALSEKNCRRCLPSSQHH